MTPATHSEFRGLQRSPPTTTSDPLGSFTTADRNLSCSWRKRSSLPARSAFPNSGPPLMTRRVGSPPVWESITLTLCQSLRVIRFALPPSLSTKQTTHPYYGYNMQSSNFLH